MSAAPPQFKIDGVWVQCQRTEDYGALGERFLCNLAKTSGQPLKVMLLRLKDWDQLSNPDFIESVPLELKLTSDPQSAMFRAVRGKFYPRTLPTDDGSRITDTCSVFQQDVSGLPSLRDAIVQAKKTGQSKRIWQLFYSACKALNQFGKNVATSGQTIPLQCPTSLAVGTGGQVVLLDADIRVGGDWSSAADAVLLYKTWFGEKGSCGVADVNEASLLHSRALLVFFRQIVGSTDQQTSRKLPMALAKTLAKFDQVPAGITLDDMEDWLRNNGEDWSLPIENEEEGQTVAPQPPAIDAVPVSMSHPKKRSVLLVLSAWFNLLLTFTVFALLLLVGVEALAFRDNPDESTKFDSAVLFSSYCVVFPTQGTIGEKVNGTLSELFPGKVQEVKRTPGERDQLLDQKLKEVLADLPEPDKLKQLLATLASDHAIRFKGFAAVGQSDGLSAVIERGGVFTITGIKEEHGSLLQTDSLDKILAKAKKVDGPDARKLLSSLRKAVADYASLKDALSIVGDRPAFLINVEPTAAGHDLTRKKLLSRLDKPVFSSRPVPGLFDAVDPTSDTGGGSAIYTLRLERPCFWRAASKDDRQNVDFATNESNNRLRWVAFAENQLIEWKPTPLKKKTGKTEPTVSFDIAVVLGNKVVVFRNQNILLGDTKGQVLKQARDYIDQGLRLKIDEIEEGVNVRQQGQQVAGAMNYSYLADLVTGSGGDVEVCTKEEFARRLKQDDDQVRGQ